MCLFEGKSIMKLTRRVLLILSMVVVLAAGVLPTFAAVSGFDVSANADGCTLYVSVDGEVPAKLHSDEAKGKRDTFDFFLLITGMETEISQGANFTFGYFSGDFPINAAPGATITVFVYADAGHTVLRGSDTEIAPEGCYEPIEIIPVTADCPYPPSPLLGQLRINGAVTTYWAPRLNAATTNPAVTLDVGTSWWILEARDGFYKVFIACYAQYVWVTPDQVGPNFDIVWGGRALPNAGTQP